RDAIDRTDWRDFCGRAGEENLVGEIEQLTRYRLLAHLEAVLPGEVHYRIAGNTLQDGVRHRRGVNDAVPDEEEVFTGALAHVAVDAKTDALGEAQSFGLHADQLA